jgi:hypothetical protein
VPRTRGRRPAYAGAKGVFGRFDCSSPEHGEKCPDRVLFFEWYEAMRAKYKPCTVCQPQVLRLGDRPGFSHPAIGSNHVAIHGRHRPDSAVVIEAVQWGRRLGLLVVSYGAIQGRVLYVPYGQATEKQEREQRKLLAGGITATLANAGASTISIW